MSGYKHLGVAGPKRTQGSALVIAIILLLLAAVVVVLMVPVGLFEQRTSGNDLRAKLAQGVAETGLTHAKEFVRLNSDTLLPKAGEAVGGMWVPCTATDESFPCGAVPELLEGKSFRVNHYRYFVDDKPVITFPAIPGTSLTAGKLLSSAGNFPATYDVGMLLCRLADTPSCTTVPGATLGQNVVTFVSRGSLTSEGTTSTISESIGTYRLINIPPEVPPLMAAGNLQGLGSLTIVGNPNASPDFGAPLSIWARNSVDTNNGSWQTCALDEYSRTGSAQYVGTKLDVFRCLDCECPAANDKRLSYKGKEGVDILDSDDTDGGQLRATSNYFFPCDLFKYIFGFDARSDENKDGLCEKLIDRAPSNGVADVEEFLTANAKVDTCAGLDSADMGLVWVKSSCGAGNQISGQVGSPDHPIALVIDGDWKPDNGVVIYGIVFLRYPGSDSTECTTGTGTGCPALLTGGGKARIYGSMVIEGGGNPNANIDLVFVPQILKNLAENPSNYRFAVIPGSWTDRLSY